MEQAEVYMVTTYIGTHTERDAVQIEQAELYMVTLVRTQRGAVQMEQAEVYRVSAWTHEAKNGEEADKAHGEESCVAEIVSCFSDWTKLGSLTNRDPRLVKSAL